MVMRILFFTLCIGFFIIDGKAKLTPPQPKKIVSQLEKAIDDSGLKRKNLGIYVSEDSHVGNAVVFSLNGKKKFIPASLTKLVPAAAILDELPIGHQFLTQLKSTAPIEKRVLKGDLYLVGGGDPGFVSESMWFLVNEFLRNGVDVIQGDIYIDDTRFDNVRYDNGRSSTRVDRAYDAPISAMSFNWNSVNVYVRPGEKVGAPAKVFADPANAYIRVINGAKTSGGSKQSLKVSREKGKDLKTGFDIIRVSGTIGKSAEEEVFYKGVTRPSLWSGYNLLSFLQQRGIQVSGQIKRGQVPAGARLLAESKSKSLAAIVGDMMKYSNNYVAEMLTKNLAYEKGARPGTMGDGITHLHGYLEKVGLNRRSFTLENPSGLTRDNHFRPMDLHQLLTRIKNRFTIYPEFLTSFPVSGVDGSLKDRNYGAATGWIRAKTGTLNGVVGLSGYAGKENGTVKTFVFVFNGPAKHTYKARNFFDRLAQVLVTN